MPPGVQVLGRSDREPFARRRGDVGHRDARAAGSFPALALEAARTVMALTTGGQRRGDQHRRPRGPEASDQPVNRGPFALLVVDMMKCVRSTIRVTAGRVSGSSNGPETGGLPARRRIQAAWRASTEWMASAEARYARDVM